MDNINNIIKFYRDCYQFDTQGIKINTFFSRSCEHIYIPETLELLSTSLECPVPTTWGAEVEQTLILDSKEKALYAGSIFVKAKTKQIGKTINSITPLYIHEIDLQCRDEVYFIKIIDTFINPPFIDCLNSIDENLNVKFDSFIEKIPLGLLNFENIVKLEAALKSILPTWNLDGIMNVNKADFDNFSHVSKLKKESFGKEQLYANLILGIFKKPLGSRGVISELTQIAEKKISSKLLNNYFNGTTVKISTPKSRPIHVPTSLSEAQKKVFYSKDSNDISLVIGPPGTGKSHTIAALVIDVINSGESVLIASKNNQAGKVIFDKVENDFGIKKILIKTERQTYKRSLISRLNKLALGFSRVNKTDLNDLERHFKSLHWDIEELIEALTSIEKKEIKWGEFYYENRSSFFTKLKEKWIEFQKRNTNTVWKINGEITKKQNLKIKLLKQFVKLRFEQMLVLTLKDKRTEFLHLIEALKEQSGNALEEKFENIDFDLILKALPAWICNTQDISKILPLKKELFDVVIIDEASQCDIATMIPLLYRAKKIVVVGDPMQLRHYSFLSDYRQSELRNKYNIEGNIANYRKKSFLDLTNKVIVSQDQLTFLNEHYRSNPDLITFSNEKFYDGNLKLMRAAPHSVKVESNVIIEVDGKRKSDGVNVEEAESVLDKLQGIVNQEQELSDKVCSKIGILSPFTSQTKYIKSLVRKAVDNKVMKRHKILIGTPYHFQGEERDIMLLSIAIDNDSHPSVYNYLNKEDVFNVSITRARNLQFIFTSLSVKSVDTKHLIGQYLIELRKVKEENKMEDTYYDGFSQEVSITLKGHGFHKIYKSAYVSGVEIDLAVVHNEKTYCIDIIGYPGAFSRQFTPEHIQMLNRMNHNIFFLPYSSWVLEKEKVIKNLLVFLYESS